MSSRSEQAVVELRDLLDFTQHYEVAGETMKTRRSRLGYSLQSSDTTPTDPNELLFTLAKRLFFRLGCPASSEVAGG